MVCSGSDFRVKIRRENVAEKAADRLVACDSKQPLHLRVPGLDAAIQVDGQDADAQRIDDVLVELLEALDLRRLLLQRMVQARVLDGDGEIAGNRSEKLDVLARQVITIYGFAESEDRNHAVAETARNKIVQSQLFQGAADRFRFRRAAH